MGLVANGAKRSDPKSLPEHESFPIGRRKSFTPSASGYLYCFANDAWHAYHNNKGSVTLTVSRA